MMKLLTFYLDTVDTSAFQKAESRQQIGRYDPPVTPLIVPWIVGGPILAWLQTPSPIWFFVFTATCVLSLAAYSGFVVFYFKRVYAYRRELGVNSEDLRW